MIEIVRQEINLVEKDHTLMNDDELLAKIKSINKKFTDMHVERTHKIHDSMKISKFERTLAIIVSKRMNNTAILIAVTETLVCVFARNDDWIERVADANIMTMYENLLLIQDIELTENVTSLDPLGTWKPHARKARTPDHFP